jgi:hypothetical protein
MRLDAPAWDLHGFRLICGGQPKYSEKYVERRFDGGCGQVEKVARAYLKTRGFTEAACADCPRSLRSPGALLDAQGKVVGALQMRGELTDFKPPFWLWSSPLHGIIHLSARPKPSTCSFGLLILFASLHTMVQSARSLECLAMDAWSPSIWMPSGFNSNPEFWVLAPGSWLLHYGVVPH